MIPQTPKEVLEAALQHLDSSDSGPYNKCIVILLNDTQDNYSRGVMSNGLAVHELIGLMHMSAFDVLSESSSWGQTDEDQEDDDEPWRPKF